MERFSSSQSWEKDQLLSFGLMSRTPFRTILKSHNLGIIQDQNEVRMLETCNHKCLKMLFKLCCDGNRQFNFCHPYIKEYTVLLEVQVHILISKTLCQLASEIQNSTPNLTLRTLLAHLPLATNQLTKLKI